MRSLTGKKSTHTVFEAFFGGRSLAKWVSGGEGEINASTFESAVSMRTKTKDPVEESQSFFH